MVLRGVQLEVQVARIDDVREAELSDDVPLPLLALGGGFRLRHAAPSSDTLLLVEREAVDAAAQEDGGVRHHLRLLQRLLDHRHVLLDHLDGVLVVLHEVERVLELFVTP